MFTINLLYCITFYKHRFMFYLFTNDLFFRQRIFNYSVFGEVFFVGGGGHHFSHMPPAAFGLVTPLYIAILIIHKCLKQKLYYTLQSTLAYLIPGH